MANIINNGNGNGIQVPIGYRFRPTDEELLLHYLKRKVHSLPLPASVIPDHFHLFQSHPSHLPGDSKEKRYFFCKRKWNHVKECRTTTISDGSGYWKAIGKHKAINVTAAAVGTKKSFVFYQGTPRPHALKTRWFMVEYRLVPSQTTTNSTQELEYWVVCCIYQRKRKAKNHGISNKTRRNLELEEEEEGITASCDGMMDFMNLESSDQFGPPLPSPTCSSGNIRFSNDELLDQEEEEECCSRNSFTPYFSCF